jgi:ribosomal protein L21E
MKSVGQSVELLIKSSRRNRKPSKKTGKTCEAVSEGKRSVIVHVYKKHGKHILALVGKEECITQKLKFLYYIN